MHEQLVVYALLMLNERLQILVSPEQRKRLETEARRRGTSVATLVREAIDSRFGAVTREARLRAVAEIRDARGGRFLPPEELERLIGEEREDLVNAAER